MSRKYAAGTEVDVDRTLGEIRRTVMRFGATRFASAVDESYHHIGFQVRDLTIEMKIPIPKREDFVRSSSGRSRTESAVFADWEKECKRRMRSLAAVIKAKLIAIDDKVATIEQEFLPYIVLPTGLTIGETLIPKLPALSNGALALPSGS